MKSFINKNFETVENCNIPIKGIKKEPIQFKLPHPSMIEMDEIKDSLSRKEPLLFFEFNNIIYVHTHRSITWKAAILKIKNTLPISFDTGLSPLKQKWVQWVKKVKTAKWGDAKEEIIVKMIFPKI